LSSSRSGVRIRDIARHGLGGLSPPPPKQKYSPPPKGMKPRNPFGLGLMFFARFASKN